MHLSVVGPSAHFSADLAADAGGASTSAAAQNGKPKVVPGGAKQQQPLQPQTGDRRPRLQNCFSVVGTPLFMAPEIWNLSGIGQVVSVSNPVEGYGPPCDMWSCGVIFFKLLSGCAGDTGSCQESAAVAGMCPATGSAHSDTVLVLGPILCRRALPFNGRSYQTLCDDIKSGVLDMVRRGNVIVLGGLPDYSFIRPLSPDSTVHRHQYCSR